MVAIAQRLVHWFVEPAMRVRFPLATPAKVSLLLAIFLFEPKRELNKLSDNDVFSLVGKWYNVFIDN